MGIGVKSGWHPYVHGHVCSPLMFPYGVVRPVVDLGRVHIAMPEQ